MMLNAKSLTPTLSRAKFIRSPFFRSSSCIDTILSHRHHDAAIFNLSRKAVNHRALFYSSLTIHPSQPQHQHQIRLPKTRLSIRHNFSYAGPRKLGDVLKIEQIQDKSKVEISDLWMTYHEGKEKVHGLILDGDVGKRVLGRAAQCPFFIHPVFRDEGHFMILSQFQPPNHFLLAFLEDYKLDPSRAQPLLTLSIFDDLIDSKDLALLRCDIISNGIEDDEGYKLCKCLVADYSEEESFTTVHLFNKKPDAFDVDEFLEERKRREETWKADA